jgi:hypothetical protein
MDPVTIAAAFAALNGIAKVIASFKESDLTPDQLAKKKAIEEISRGEFDAYVKGVTSGNGD